MRKSGTHHIIFAVYADNSLPRVVQKVGWGTSLESCVCTAPFRRPVFLLIWDDFAHGITQNITLDGVIIKRLVRTLAFSGFGLIDVHGPNTHNKKRVRCDLKIMTPWIRIVYTSNNLRSALFFWRRLHQFFFCFVNGPEDLLGIHGYKRVNTAGVFKSQQE